VELLQPWPEPYTVNRRSPYGPRVHPITGRRTFHHGIDVAMPIGTPVTAGADGEIVHKGNNGSGGVTLIIRHANNMHTVYYHLQKPSPHRIGTRVRAGEFVAYSGNTGASTGPHLHYELRRSRNWGDTIDPQPHIVKSQSVGPIVETQSKVPVTGRMDRATIKEIQTQLKKAGHYAGWISGTMGPKTRRAIQAWAGVNQDGIIGPITRRAVQGKLGVTQDGVWGPITISAWQRLLNGRGM
jgi:murein DD-endopeptidase MepM/ murein hydrolase activator NlpD